MHIKQLKEIGIEECCIAKNIMLYKKKIPLDKKKPYTKKNHVIQEYGIRREECYNGKNITLYQKKILQ